MDDNSWGDEFEVEVTDLRTGQRSHVRPPEADGLFLPAEPRTSSVPLDDGLAPIPVEVSASSRASRRRATIAATVLTLAALVVFLLPSSPLSLNRVTPSATPTPTTAISSSASTFYTIHAVPWGILKVDGKETVAIMNGSDYANVTLAPGTHSIEYTAPPFPAIHCQVNVPDQGKDTCPVDHNANDAPNLPDPSARVLDLSATIANLPPGEMTALTAKIDGALKALGGRTQVQAGDHYLDASGTTQVAGVNMLAIVSYGLAGNYQQQQGCGAICDQQGMGAGPGGPAWIVMATLVESWRYIQANGPATSGPQIGQNSAPLYRAFAVTWNGGWQVSDLESYGSLSCMSGSDALTQDISSANPNFFQNTTIQQSSNTQTGSDAVGCVISIAPSDSSGTPTGPVAYFLYRCGALIAVNQAAQALFPGAPAPSAHEQQLANQLIATIGAQG